MLKTVPFQTIQFSISTQLSSILPINRTKSSATIPGQNGPGSKGNEGILCILQSSSITEAPPSNCLVSYPGHSLVGWSYPSAEVQSVTPAAPSDRATEHSLVGVGVGFLPFCRSAISVFYSPTSWLESWCSWKV